MQRNALHYVVIVKISIIVATTGNFLAILKLLSDTNFGLKHHLDAPSARNATYISLRIQHELIDIIIYDI